MAVSFLEDCSAISKVGLEYMTAFDFWSSRTCCICMCILFVRFLVDSTQTIRLFPAALPRKPSVRVLQSPSSLQPAAQWVWRELQSSFEHATLVWLHVQFSILCPIWIWWEVWWYFWPRWPESTKIQAKSRPWQGLPSKGQVRCPLIAHFWTLIRRNFTNFHRNNTLPFNW